ncbi:flavin reductase family protein [Micromonospora tulbaghiae]|uniref:flavin reductase family protein n=1 Tax=Micromonospora TaxID=1873 RepID=UPI0013B8C601|nr:flavin reductase family protein [Micromonospora aurantiaca]
MVSAAEFRTALARFPSGVTLITTRGGREGARGLTVSAFCSVSLEPSLVLACVARSARTLPVLLRAGRFGVSLLGARHRGLAHLFASTATDKFQGAWTTLVPDGCPVLPDAVFAMECLVHSTFTAGDHEVIIGAVEAVAIGDEEAIVFHNRAMRHLGEPMSAEPVAVRP